MIYDIWSTCMLVPGFSRSECASWVQAWGSVLAILAAPAIAMWQMQHHAKAGELERARSLLTRLNSFRLLVMQAKALGTEVYRAWDDLEFKSAHSYEDEIEHVHKRILEIPAHDVGDTSFLVHLMLVEARIRAILDILREPFHGPEGDDRTKQQLVHCNSGIEQALIWCNEAVHALEHESGRRK